LFSLEKALGRTHCGLPILNRAYIQETDGLSTCSDSNGTRGNDFKLKEERFNLDDSGKFFTERAVRLWHSCPEELWCPIPGGTQGQVGWGPGQPELVGAALPTAGDGSLSSL